MAESKDEIKNRNGGTSGATRIITVLKGWYTTNVLLEPEFRAQEAMLRLMEQEAAEIEQIISRAKKNGAYLKTPNGKPTNLTERQWVLVRTKRFKEKFGDWERATQVSKLMKSEPIVATGEWKGKYELNRHSATKYVLEDLRGEYTNEDTGATVSISRKSRKTTSHGGEVHLSTVVLLPQLIENSIYLGEESNEKDKHGFDSFRYYAVRLKIGDTDYVVRLTTGVENGELYYDHSLMEIKKEGLADQRDLLDTQVYDRRGPPSAYEDRRLISFLQVDFSKFSNIIDEDGEPKSTEVEAFERGHKTSPFHHVRWLKQSNKVVGWFNPVGCKIVLCEGHDTSIAIKAFWHATFHFTETNAPDLHNKMLAYARRSSKSMKYAFKKFYPEFKAGSDAWFDKLGAMRFVTEYADDIEESLNNDKKKSFFASVLHVFSHDKVNLVRIGRRSPEKAVAILADAFARGKHPA